MRISGFFFANKSENLVFSFVSPFVITSHVLEFDQSGVGGSWSVINIDNNASAIYYSVRLADCSFIPCSGQIYTAATFSTNDLLSRNDHGRYTIVLPFGEGEAPWLIRHLPNSTSFLNDLTTKIQFRLFLTTHDAIVISFPPVLAEATYRYGGQGPAFQEYFFGNASSTLTLVYDNATEIDGNNTSLSFGLFFLGIGLPLMVSSPLEIYRDAKSASSGTSQR